MSRNGNTIHDEYSNFLKEIRINTDHMFSFQVDDQGDVRSHLKQMQKNARKNKAASVIFGYSDGIRKKIDEAIVSIVRKLENRYENIDGIGTKEYRHHLYFQSGYLAYFPWKYSYFTDMKGISSVIVGAAKWIAREIDKAGKTKELDEILKEEYSESEDVIMLTVPPHIDAEFDETRINSIVRLLWKRNKSEKDKYREDRGKNERTLINTATAEGMFNANSKERNRYLRMINLIPEESIESALRHLEEYGMSIVDMVFKNTEEYNKKIEEKVAQVYETANLHNRKIDQYQKECEEQKKRVANLRLDQMLKPGANPLMGSPLNLNANAAKTVGGMYSAMQQITRERDPFHMNELRNLGKKVEELKNEIEDINKDRCDWLYNRIRAIDYIDFPQKYEEDSGYEYPDMSELITPKNPYEMAFAILWGLENNNPWAWGAGFADLILIRTVHMMPWNINDYEWRPDSVKRRVAEFNKTRSANDQLLIPEDIIKSGEKQSENNNTDENTPPTRKINPAYMYDNLMLYDDEHDTYNSFAQVIYRETGIVIPTANEYMSELYDVFVRAGMGDDEANMMAAMAGALHASRAKLGGFVASAKGTVQDERKQSAKIEELEKRIAEMQEKADKADALLYEAEKKAKNLENELEEQSKGYEAERKELADLREIVFSLESGEKPEEEKEEEIEWPYEVKKDTLIFGGFETWTKAISPMLKGNVRFINRDAALHVDTRMMRKAESIWIQINAISHPAYFRITDAAKMMHKQIHYFRTASAAGCAAQLVKVDME